MGQDFLDKINNFVAKINNALNLKSLPFTFIIDDPAGNSFIENPFAPNTDPYATIKFYDRTREMSELMGYGTKDENHSEIHNEENDNKNEEGNLNKSDKVISSTKNIPTYYDNKKKFEVYKSDSKLSSHLMDFTISIENNSVKEEAMKFQTFCFCCGLAGEAYSCICTIPFFKEIIINSFKCQECGYKCTDIKGGGGMSEKATKFTLKVDSWKDLNRDIFKSETASICIPELDFETDSGSLGSMFTTVEGILEKIESNIKNMPFSQGDSNEANLLDNFCQTIRNLTKLEKPFTLILDDPLSNSFIFPASDSLENDIKLEKIEYERTWEQNEELGINDMKVENYGEI
jgi:zinc finger protein